MPEARISVRVDDRECRGALIDVMRRMDEFMVRVERLPVGDYRVDDRFLFERKTVTDLVTSIESGRLFRQTLRLVHTERLRPALLIEGKAGDWRACGMSREAVQGALVTVALFAGLPILRTGSPVETARTFLFAARQGRTVALGALPRHGRRPRGKAAAQYHLLQGLPGVGPEKARRLLERFGSVRAVMAAGEDELGAVKGIGRETARRITWAVDEEATPYTLPPVPGCSEHVGRRGQGVRFPPCPGLPGGVTDHEREKPA